MADQEPIATLNDQPSREVTTFLRYMLQGAGINGAEWESVRVMYLSEVTDEVGHAQSLADRNQLIAPKMQMEQQTADEDRRAE